MNKYFPTNTISGNPVYFQRGISSLTVLIIVTLAVFIAWELSQYVNNYSARNSAGLSSPDEKGNQKKNCIRTDPRDCDDRDEAVDYQGN